MTKRPIIMSAPMILGLLARRKSQTRRTRGLERFTDRGEPHGYGIEKRRWGVRFQDSIPDDPVPVFEPCPYPEKFLEMSKALTAEAVRRSTP